LYLIFLNIIADKYLKIIILFFLQSENCLIYLRGIGDWGLGIGDWGLGQSPNPQSPD